jgi:predicted lipid-binding transport protein (Tim44 family)
MRFSKSAFTAIALAAAVALTATAADARVGRSGFGGIGSRGINTFSKPPVTNTAPNTASPIQRSVTQPSAGPAAAAPAATGGGFMGRPGFMGGLFTGLLGAGLFGMLFGSGFFGGISGFGGMLGLILQATLIFFVVRWLFSLFARRQAPAYAGPTPRPEAGFAYRGLGVGAGGGGRTAPLEVTPADLDAFEEKLGAVQAAFSEEDIGKLRALMTPEMVSEISDELAANAGHGLVNKVEDVKLLQGDVAEAWREGRDDYATVAMRFSLRDRMVERESGRVVEERPSEATELWTFRRADGGRWLLSAIQQA